MDAFEHWKDLGGNAESKSDRISWERNKIRRTLASQHVDNAGKLLSAEK